jgi:hypothetical protein
MRIAIVLLALALVGCGRSKVTNALANFSSNTLLNPAPTPAGGNAAADDPTPPALGSTAATAAAGCQALLNAGFNQDGVYWVKHLQVAGGEPFQVYCQQHMQGGGWALLYNSVLRAGTTEFWNIPYAQRLSVKGAASVTDNFYYGSLYFTGTKYMDVIEDTSGKSAVAMIASATGIDPTNMRLLNPSLISGSQGIYDSQFASGWAAPDYDADAYANNCSSFFASVTQHYSACWIYNLGSDADTSFYDDGMGPHVHAPALAGLGLTGDGSAFSRVKRISRFIRW